MSAQLDLIEALERVKTPERNLYRECLVAAYDWLDRQRDGVYITAGTLAVWAGAGLEPAEPRVWGAVMRELHRRKRIVPTDQITTAGRSHRGMARVWQVKYAR